jgi:hypothetical protein
MMDLRQRIRDDALEIGPQTVKPGVGGLGFMMWTFH